MPRRSKGPRLYLREQAGRQPVWVVRDGQRYVSTGCGAGDTRGAEGFLSSYIARKHTPPQGEGRLQRLTVADVINVYLTERGPHVANREFLVYTAAPILQWWQGRTLADVRGATCREYVEWRCRQGVSDQTARHDLKTLRAAIRHYHAEHGPLDAVPVVTLPEQRGGRDRWLTVSEAAAMLRACRGSHVSRLLLIGLHTGTRPGAITALKWLPSPSSGWIDLEHGILHRRGAGERETKKRRPPAKLPRRLIPHLRRWRQRDLSQGVAHVIHWQGAPVSDVRTAWGKARARAGLGPEVTPHVLRHTCVTWLLQSGVDPWEVAGFVGMSLDVLLATYGHHCPDSQARAAMGRR